MTPITRAIEAAEAVCLECSSSLMAGGHIDPRLANRIAALRDAVQGLREGVQPVDERAEFERWAGDYGRVFSERDGDGYAFPYTQEAWVGWQARAMIAAPPAPAQRRTTKGM